MSKKPTPKRDAVLSLIKRVAGQGNVLTIPRLFIDLCDGDHLAALALSQMCYWGERTADGSGWFSKSYEDWHDELALSQYQMSRIGKKLQKVGLIETALRRSPFHEYAPVLHYRVVWPELSKCIMKKLDNHDCEETQQSDYQETSQSSYTETTPETTPETTKAPKGALSRAKKARQPSPHEPLYNALLDAHGYKPEAMTRTASKSFWVVAAELHKIDFPVHAVKELHLYVRSKAERENWNSVSVMALSKYAPDFLARMGAFFKSRPPETPEPESTPPEDDGDYATPEQIAELNAKFAALVAAKTGGGR